jgi:hypothetical protein
MHILKHNPLRYARPCHNQEHGMAENPSGTLRSADIPGSAVSTIMRWCNSRGRDPVIFQILPLPGK